jgi:Ca2+-binding RTX toxin-like protein
MVLVALVVLVLAAAASPAQAAVVKRPTPALIAVLAAPGEANALRVEGDGSRVTISDAAAPLGGGEGCERLDGSSVRCAVSGDDAALVVSTGDRADRVTLAGRLPAGLQFGVSLDGGDGADVIDASGLQGAPPAALRLTGGPGADRITGGGGSDDLMGGGGSDVLAGGPGNDSLAGDDEGFGGRSLEPTTELTVAADHLDGGDGADTVSYAARVRGVRADLRGATTTNGQRGERDALTGFENATGGRGADSLIGDGRRNVLAGGPGRDALDGQGGDDAIYGEACCDLAADTARDTLRGHDGHDSLYGTAQDGFDGGPGQDRIQLWAPAGAKASAPSEARPRCGAGDDGVWAFTASVVVPAADCETIVNGGVSVEPRAGVSDGARRAVFAVRCPALSGPGCKTSVTVARAGSKTTKGGPVRSSGTVPALVPVRLDPGIRRALRRREPVLVRVTVTQGALKGRFAFELR